MKKSLRVSVVVVWTAIITGTVVGIAGPSYYSYIQTVALVLTLFGVLWYADVNRRMYHEISRQTKIAVDSHTSYKLSVAAEWLLKLDQHFDTYYKDRHGAVCLLLDGKGE